MLLKKLVGLKINRKIKWLAGKNSEFIGIKQKCI